MTNANPICLGCHREIEPGERRRYIYPVPSDPVNLRDAGYAHLNCAGELRQRQIELGLLSIIPPNPIFHGHA